MKSPSLPTGSSSKRNFKLSAEDQTSFFSAIATSSNRHASLTVLPLTARKNKAAVTNKLSGAKPRKIKTSMTPPPRPDPRFNVFFSGFAAVEKWLDSICEGFEYEWKGIFWESGGKAAAAKIEGDRDGEEAIVKAEGREWELPRRRTGKKTEVSARNLTRLEISKK